MMQDILNSDDIDYTDFLSENARNSQFYLGLEDSCGFLLPAIKAVQAQPELVPKCCVSPRKCPPHLTDLIDRLREAADEIQIHINRMQQAVTQRQQEAEEFPADLQPLIDSLPERATLPSIDETNRYDKRECRLHRNLSGQELGPEERRKIEGVAVE
jgi:hypothetical protein